MKKLFAIVTVSLAGLAAFAQGKIGFNNDSLHLVYWGPGPFAGQAVNSDNIPLGIPGLAVDLYMGTSSSLLYLYSSATFGPLAIGPGKWTSVSVQANANPTTGAPAIPGGTTAFVQVAVLSTERPAPNVFDPAAFQTFILAGFSTEFTFTLGGPITYPPMWGANGNWPAGTWPMDQYGIGSRGAITFMPEPSAGILLGLGAAAMLLFSRRR